MNGSNRIYGGGDRVLDRELESGGMERENAPDGRYRGGDQDRELLDRPIALQEREEWDPEASPRLLQEERDVGGGSSAAWRGAGGAAGLHRAVREEEAVRAAFHP